MAYGSLFEFLKKRDTEVVKDAAKAAKKGVTQTERHFDRYQPAPAIHQNRASEKAGNALSKVPIGSDRTSNFMERHLVYMHYTCSKLVFAALW